MPCSIKNEEVCSQLIAMIKKAHGRKLHELLEKLCTFRTAAADKFWKEHIGDDRYLPYMMMSRSCAAGDFFAENLEEQLDDILDADRKEDISAAEVYFLMSGLVFKDCSGLFRFARKAARNYDKLSRLGISWSAEDLADEKRFRFLAERAAMEGDSNSEQNFFGFLTDILIMNCADAIISCGEDETFTEQLMELYKDYPAVFTSAGFFAYFIKDSSEAYDRFGRYMIDPADYHRLFWVLDGVYCSDGVFYQGTPAFYVGPENRKVHYNLRLSGVDERFRKFVCEKCYRDAVSVSADIIYTDYFLDRISGLVCCLCDSNGESASMARQFLFKSIMFISTAPETALGRTNKRMSLLREFGRVTDEEFLTVSAELFCEMAKKRLHICFNAICSVCPYIDRNIMMKALADGIEILRSGDPDDEQTEFIRKSEKQLAEADLVEERLS